MSRIDEDPKVRAIAYSVLEQAKLPRSHELVRMLEGCGNHVYAAGDLMVRIGTGTDGQSFPRALAVLRAAAVNACVPKILYADTTTRTLPYPVMVHARLPGRTLSGLWSSLDAVHRLAVLESLSHELVALHSIPASAAVDAGFSEPWWADSVAYIEREVTRHRVLGDIPAAWLDHMESYVAEHRDALIQSPAACLVHGDLTWANVLVDGDRVTGLIDFDDACAGPAEEDYWQLLFQSGLEHDPWMPLVRLRQLPGFALDAPRRRRAVPNPRDREHLRASRRHAELEDRRGSARGRA